jgi:hypothetical protein
MTRMGVRVTPGAQSGDIPVGVMVMNAAGGMVFFLSLSSHLGGRFMSLYYPLRKHRLGITYLY